MASMSVQSSSTMMRVRADGGASLSIASGDMGKLSLGDVSGAVDAIDDINDWGYEGRLVWVVMMPHCFGRYHQSLRT